MIERYSDKTEKHFWFNMKSYAISKRTDPKTGAAYYYLRHKEKNEHE